MPSPYIFTFYSFKGGVGRSMAAMNTAYALSGRGRHVLLVDMDLEAPGISGFLERTGELDGKASGSSLDILALLEEALVVANNNGPATLPKASEKLPGIATYARSVLLNKLMKPKVGLSGRLDVLGIAKDSHGRLTSLGLADLNHEKLVALSSVLFYYFKAQRFPFRPLGVEDFEPPVETPYDYVLVDSRTGLTEIGGLCVGPLADRLVVLTGLNDQNVQGTADFLEMVGIKPRTAETGRWDEADPGEKDSVPSLGPKPTILVASPVPAGEMDYRRKRLDELEKRLGIRPVTLSYHPQMALMETVMVRDYPDEYLGREYIVLTNRLMEQVLDDGESLMAPVVAFAQLKKGDLDHAIDRALKLISIGNPFGPVFSMQYPDSVGARPLGRRLLAALAASNPSMAGALQNWGIALATQAKTKDGAEADRLYEAAYAKYVEALRVEPDMHEALSNWGVALAAQAKTKDGAEAVRLYEAAYAKYAEALRVKPDKHEALSNWGAALGAQAKTKYGAEADRLHEAAYAKYAEALKVKPDLDVALNNWGGELVNQANTKTGTEREMLLALSREKSLVAERILGGSGAYNLACVEALLGNGVEAVRWLRQARIPMITRARLAEERDFDAIRHTDEFLRLVESLPVEESVQ